MIAPKILLKSTTGYRPELDGLVTSWMQRGVKYCGVYGVDASHVEDAIDELCIGDGSNPYDMLTAFHDESERLEEALELADSISEEFGIGIELVEL